MNHPRSRLAYWITRFVNHKRALGFSYQGPEFVLRALCRHVERCGYSDLTAHGFDSWMATYQKHHPNTRSKWYSTVRYFCLYRRRREPDCFLPDADGVPKRQPHLLPVIVEPEQIARMLPLASNLLPNYQSPLRAPTTRLAIVLLYTCGLRLGELARLTLSDVEDDGRVLRIRDSKGHKSRLVPLSASATQELKAYLEQREAVLAMASDAPLLCNREGGRFFHRYTPNGLRKVISYLFTEAGVRDEQGRRPRVHDLRTALPYRCSFGGIATRPTSRSNYPSWPYSWGTFPFTTRLTTSIGFLPCGNWPVAASSNSSGILSKEVSCEAFVSDRSRQRSVSLFSGLFACTKRTELAHDSQLPRHRLAVFALHGKGDRPETGDDLAG